MLMYIRKHPSIIHTQAAVARWPKTLTLLLRPHAIAAARSIVLSLTVSLSRCNVDNVANVASFLLTNHGHSISGRDLILSGVANGIAVAANG